MNTNPGTVTVWQSGRLAPRAGARRLAVAGITREQWLGAALLALSALVLTAFVVVLERDVARSATQRVAQRNVADDPDPSTVTAAVSLVAGR